MSIIPSHMYSLLTRVHNIIAKFFLFHIVYRVWTLQQYTYTYIQHTYNVDIGTMVRVTRHVIGSRLLLYGAIRSHWKITRSTAGLFDDNRLHRTITHGTHAPHSHARIT